MDEKRAQDRRKEPKKQPARTLEARKSSFYFDFYSHWLTAASKHMDIYLFCESALSPVFISVFLFYHRLAESLFTMPAVL